MASGTAGDGPHGDASTPDPFRTARLRDRVLDAWSASAARFREDSNAEEDLSRGSYRDRVVIELAQNAADAAERARVPGRLSLRLTGDLLTASNTGEALSRDGAESLSNLRASAKRDASSAVTGRFGVGFAAVLAVTDEPRVASTSGALRWSAGDALHAVRGVPTLAAELSRRRGHVAVLRLPFPADDEPEPGFTTTVRLPLRDEAAMDLARGLLDDVDDALLLALPALEQIRIEVGADVRLVSGADRWQVVRRSGGLDPALLGDRPIEERDRPWWSLTWAKPVAGQGVPATLHAPTPTDEPLELPALLIASFPLDPGRRHVAPGPLTDFLIGRAAAAYADLVAQVDDALALVPTPVPVGPLDGALRAAILEALAGSPLLRTADGRHLRPRDATAVDVSPAVLVVLADVLPDLVQDLPALSRLGTRKRELADIVDELAGVDRPPAWWRTLYDALASSARADLVETLGALPVPLADGRTVRGVRGVLLPAEQLPAGLDRLGLRAVHPAAAHPLLLRLGAVSATPAVVLEQPEVRAAVERAWDLEDPADITEPVLALVEDSDGRVAGHGWLGDLPLPDDEGDLAAARDLVLPGSLLEQVTDPEEVGRPAPELVDRWGAAVLVAVGVLSDLTVSRVSDVLLDHGVAAPEIADLDDADTWQRAVVAPAAGLGAIAPELLAVRDLDLVRDDAWLAVLCEIAGHRGLREAVVTPTAVVRSDGGRVAVTSYAAWWIGRHARLQGRPPTAYALPGDLVGLYDELPGPVTALELDDELLGAIGVRSDVSGALSSPDSCSDVLARLADPARPVSDDVLTRVYVELAGLDPDALSLPDRLRVRAHVVVDAADAVVADAPHHLQCSWPAPPVLVPLAAAAALATALDLDTTSARLGPVDVTGGSLRATRAEVLRLLPAAPVEWCEHDDLVVAGQSVDWWVSDVDARVHACTLDGLARGLAWVAGRWERRLAVAAVLAEPDRVAALVEEARLDS